MPVDLIAESVFPVPAAAGFALSLDPHRFPACFRGFGPIPALRRIQADEAPAVGATRTVESADGALMRERITAYDPPRHHAYVLDGLRPPLRWLVREGHADWRFAGHPQGTRVTWRYRFVPTSPLAWPLAAPLLKVFMQGAMRRCLDAMRRELAGDARSPR
jgi:hypothetical protein